MIYFCLFFICVIGIPLLLVLLPTYFEYKKAVNPWRLDYFTLKQQNEYLVNKLQEKEAQIDAMQDALDDCMDNYMED